MPQLGDRPAFAKEAVQIRPLGQVSRTRDLDGHDPVELGIAGLVDCAEGPDTHRLDQLEPAELAPSQAPPTCRRFDIKPESRAAGGTKYLAAARLGDYLDRVVTVGTAD